jgi:hypothetical protein
MKRTITGLARLSHTMNGCPLLFLRVTHYNDKKEARTMEDNQELLKRIAYCVAAALVVYYAGNSVSEQYHFQLLEKYQPWMEENKIQAIAFLSAVFFGVSLALFPIPQEDKLSEPDFLN